MRLSVYRALSLIACLVSLTASSEFNQASTVSAISVW
jgi:hypothetical protein